MKLQILNSYNNKKVFMREKKTITNIIIIVIIIVVIIINFTIIIIVYRLPLVPTLYEALWDEKNTLVGVYYNGS